MFPKLSPKHRRSVMSRGASDGALPHASIYMARAKAAKRPLNTKAKL